MVSWDLWGKTWGLFIIIKTCQMLARCCTKVNQYVVCFCHLKGGTTWLVMLVNLLLWEWLLSLNQDTLNKQLWQLLRWGWIWFETMHGGVDNNEIRFAVNTVQINLFYEEVWFSEEPVVRTDLCPSPEDRLPREVHVSIRFSFADQCCTESFDMIQVIRSLQVQVQRSCTHAHL